MARRPLPYAPPPLWIGSGVTLSVQVKALSFRLEISGAIEHRKVFQADLPIMQSTTRSLLLGLVVFLSACASAGQELSEAALALNTTLPQGDTLLAAGDTIEISFPRKDEWNSSVIVRPDGKASFPFLDEVQVAGRSIGQLDHELTTLYESVFETPELSLNVSSWGSREVIVIGMVGAPGAVTMAGPTMTLLEAIGRAGGPNRRVALMKQVVLVRWLPEEGLRKAWKIDARPEHWNNSTPVFLQARDIVFVPNRPIDNVNIWIDQYIRQMIPVPQLIPGSL